MADELEPSLSWTILQHEGGQKVEFSGDIDENVLLDPLVNELRSSAVVLDLAGVRTINSCGVREWINFVGALPGGLEVTLERCSTAAVGQMNMIANFMGTAKVTSFYAPYVCEKCEREEEKLLELGEGFDPGQAPAFSCETCGEELEFDEFPESYFNFLEQQGG